MAADTRQYKSKEQDGQGNEIILRDQQLVEQASQTTMASGEYFEIVDVDGRMAKIPKANMVDIVREALGSLLNGLTDQTTVTKVPSLNGNTLGASTVATLASVLGVSFVEKGRSTDPDTTLKPGMYRIGSSSLGYGVLCVFKNSGDSSFIAQLIINASEIKYRRSTNEDGGAGGFGAWKTLTGQ